MSRGFTTRRVGFHRPTSFSDRTLTLNSQSVYFCPSDKLALDSRRKSTFAAAKHRDYSYAMNCGICHTTDMASFVAPAKTMLYMEANLDPLDYSGMTGPTSMGGGPSVGSSVLAFRHHKQGHLVMADLHVATMNTNEFRQVVITRQFWLPNNSKDTAGMFGNLR